MSINLRSFKRNKMKGIMTSAQCLKFVYTHGPREAEQPKHETIQTLINSGFVTREGKTITITDLGREYIAARHPDLREFQAPDSEEDE